MAEQEDDSKVNHCHSEPAQRSLRFVEVICKSSGRVRRFAAGTEAGFAVSLINRKLDTGNPLALYIEAVKEGEEPINFGPNAVLVDYGDGWKLQTITQVEGIGKRKHVWTTTHSQSTTPESQSIMGLDGADPTKKASQPIISFLYIGKILLAFILIFVLGAIFTLALENLPRVILFINSSM